MLNNCDTLPSVENYKYHEGCLDFLKNNYNITQRLGRGGYGVVFAFSYKDNHESTIALKVSKLSGKDSVNEVKMGCMLNQLKDLTPVFAQTFGWMVCNLMPEKWIPLLNNLKENDLTLAVKNNEPLLYIVMEYIVYKWDDKNTIIPPEDMIQMMFLLYHGLYIARKICGIVHQDLFQGNNIMLTPMPYNSIVKVDINNTSFILRDLRFTPKFIDFGQASNTYDPEDYLGDYEHIKEAFIEKLESNNYDTKIFKEFFNDKLYEVAEKTHLVKPLEDLLLYSKLFNVIPREAKGNIEARCTFCGLKATHTWKEKNINFCNHMCFTRFKNVGSFI